MRNPLLCAALSFLALAATVTPAVAQFDTATVLGTVRDASGAVVPGAKVEAFNLLNTTNFRAPSGVRSAGAFGTITATHDARQLQFGFTFLW